MVDIFIFISNFFNNMFDTLNSIYIYEPISFLHLLIFGVIIGIIIKIIKWRV